MTSRERVIVALQMGSVDRKPTLAWMGSASGADAVVVDPTDASKPHSAESILLAEVSNPFGLALQKGIDLNSALKDDPTVGGDLLDTLVEEVRLNICSSLKSGADGIFYRLHGACPKHCSPMQYGGHYLERDRELLSTASAASLNVLFVAGHEELYIDFVSDLPANVFAWDRELTQVSAGDVRSARIGATASSDPTSEITLLIGRKNYLQNLEQPNIG